jgi:hypothetical protein
VHMKLPSIRSAVRSTCGHITHAEAANRLNDAVRYSFSHGMYVGTSNDRLHLACGESGRSEKQLGAVLCSGWLRSNGTAHGLCNLGGFCLVSLQTARVTNSRDVDWMEEANSRCRIAVFQCWILPPCTYHLIYRVAVSDSPTSVVDPTIQYASLRRAVRLGPVHYQPALQRICIVIDGLTIHCLMLITGALHNITTVH